MRLGHIVPLILIIFIPISLQAKDVYKCADKNGNFYYSTTICPGGEKKSKPNVINTPSQLDQGKTVNKEGGDMPRSKTILEDSPEPSDSKNKIASEIDAINAKIKERQKMMRFYDTKQCYQTSPPNSGREIICDHTNSKYQAYALEIAELLRYRDQLLFILNSDPLQLQNRKFPCQVTQVIDGDTFDCILPNGVEDRVRLIGVDAPESGTTHGDLATAYLQSYLIPNTSVTLELDAEPRDKYGRILAYVFLADGTMINALLVQEGYATVDIYPPNDKYESYLINAQ
ncbi:MAG: thermonuclease family protein [Thermodesulfobacteriota bacterium]